MQIIQYGRNYLIEKMDRLAITHEKDYGIKMDETEMQTCTCKNCGRAFIGNFCPACGQPSKVKRITVKSLMKHLIETWVGYDSQLLRTVRNLFMRPGMMIKEYLAGHRAGYFHPLKFLAFLTTLYAAIAFLWPELHLGSGTIDPSGWKLGDHNYLRKISEIAVAIYNNPLFNSLGMVLAIAVGIRILHPKNADGTKYNLAEHFYALSYIQCLCMLVLIVLLPINLMMHSTIDNDIIDFCIQVLIYSRLLGVTRKRSLMINIGAYLIFWTIFTLILSLVIGGVYYYSPELFGGE